jgi:hypothetical protein
MDIQTQKEVIIEQFKLLNDENLIQAIKNLLEYALKKEQESLEVPEAHQKIVMERFNKVRKDPDRLVDVPTFRTENKPSQTRHYPEGVNCE